jgi:uncharacterized Zn finger protein (UPF0148 family)
MSSEVINAFMAENLLEDSHVFTRIHALQENMRYESHGERISFNDFYHRLKKDVEAIPSIRLEISIATGTENQYSIQLMNALETIIDESDRMSSLVLNFHAKLRSAQNRIEEEKSTFTSWYILAASALNTAQKVKFPAAQIKALADTEFTRICGDLNLEVETLLLEVTTLLTQIKSHKKTQQEKFDIGKDQINSTWTSSLPSFGASVAPNRSDQLLRHPEEEEEFEEEEDDSPAPFISKLNPLPVVATIDPRAVSVHTEDGGEIKGIFKKIGEPRPINQEHSIANHHLAGAKPLGTICSVCGKPQFETTSGEVCENGHGGAPAKEDEDRKAELATLAALKDEDINLKDIPAISDEKLAAAKRALTTPRKKLVIMDDDEDIL